MLRTLEHLKQARLDVESLQSAIDKNNADNKAKSIQLTRIKKDIKDFQPSDEPKETIENVPDLDTEPESYPEEEAEIEE